MENHKVNKKREPYKPRAYNRSAKVPTDEVKEKFNFKTSLGKNVSDKKYSNIDNILLENRKIKEVEL